MEIPAGKQHRWICFSRERWETKHGNSTLSSKLCILRTLTLHANLVRDLQFARTHPLEPLDVTSYGGEVLVSAFGNSDNVFDPHTPNALVFSKDIVVDVFRFPNRRQQMG